MASAPSAQYSLTVRVEIEHRPGMLGKVASAIGSAGGTIGSVDLIKVEGRHTIRDITVETPSDSVWQQLTDAVNAIPGARVLDSTDLTFHVHLGGKIEVANKRPLKTHDDLSMAYTPGVARVCNAIRHDPEQAFRYTVKRNTVAVVSDGTAVLGLGDIGPKAAMPVMEGKAMLFKEFGGVDGFPICLDTKDPDEIVSVVKAIAPGFGGINLEDISAPRCFEIEDRLRAELDIPVFHDDQHGTAVVVLAALYNALKLTGGRIEDIRIVIVGLGAAGVAVAKILMAAGARHIIGCDSRGAVHTDRADYLDGSMHPVKRVIAETTNQERRTGGVADVLDGADLFVGVSGARIVPASALAAMNPEPMVFAMANPDPEVSRGGRGVRADPRHRSLRLPQPDQQRPVLPRHLPRRARRAGHADHRADEDSRRPRDRRDRADRGAARGLHRPVGVQPRRGPGCRRRRGGSSERRSLLRRGPARVLTRLTRLTRLTWLPLRLRDRVRAPPWSDRRAIPRRAGAWAASPPPSRPIPAATATGAARSQSRSIESSSPNASPTRSP